MKKRLSFSLSLLNFYPRLFLMALKYRLAQHNLVMALNKGREDRRGALVVRGDGRIKRAKALLKGVRESFVVAAGIIGVGSHFVRQQAGIFQQALVRFVAMPEPQLVRRFAVPGQRAL